MRRFKKFNGALDISVGVIRVHYGSGAHSRTTNKKKRRFSEVDIKNDVNVVTQ